MPPGRTTRVISATPLAGSGTKKITKAIIATSNVSAGNGSAIASPRSNLARRAPDRSRAKSSWASDGSMPRTSFGAHRSTISSVKAPLPQPTSIHFRPEGSASQSIKIAPTRRLQSPIYRSYERPSSNRIWVSAITAPLRTVVAGQYLVRPVSADAWGWRSPNPPGINRRLLVSDRHIPECICRMARPIVFWAQTDTALLVLTLVIVAKRVASSFSRFIKPASRKNAPRSFYAHHRGTGSGILDRGAALEAGFNPVVDVTLA